MSTTPAASTTTTPMTDCFTDADNVVPLLATSLGILLSFLAMIGISTHGKIEESLRGILLSFLIGNFLGSIAFVYDIVTFACEYHAKALSFVFKVSMVLTLAHLLLLLLHYYIASSTKRTTKIKDFVGLIIAAWITSATIGCFNQTLKVSSSKIVVTCIFILIILSVVVSFNFVARHQIQQCENRRIYNHAKMFCLDDEATHMEEEELKEDDFTLPPIKQWNLKLVGSICLSTIVSSIPWLIINLVGLDPSQRHLEHAMPLSIYVLGFYVVAVVCIYMRYRDYKVWAKEREERKPMKPVEETIFSPAPVRESTPERKSSRQDLVSSMEQDETYGTFEL